LLIAAFLTRVAAAQTQVPPWPREAEDSSAPKPRDVQQPWRALIGEYGAEREPLYVLERASSLWALLGRGEAVRLEQVSADVFAFIGGNDAGNRLVFERDSRGGVSALSVGSARYERRQVGPAE